MIDLVKFAEEILMPPKAPTPVNDERSALAYMALCSNPEDVAAWLHELTYGDAETQELARIALKLRVTAHMQSTAEEAEAREPSLKELNNELTRSEEDYLASTDKYYNLARG